MSRFLLRISFFIVPIMLVMFPLDYFISKYLAKSTDFAYGEMNVWNDIYTSNVNSDLVIYGASRAWVFISPKIIEDSLNISSYNLGIDGQNFWLQYLRHKELLKYNNKPKQIIVSVDWATLHKNSDLYNYEQFLPYLLWNKDIKEYTDSYNGFSTFDYYIPLIRYCGEISSIKAAFKSFINYNTDTSRIKGYKGVDRDWNNDLDKAKSEIEPFNVTLDSASVQLFEQFIMECQKDNIKLMLVYAPEHIEGQEFVINREEIIAKYQYFADKYNLQFLDYSNDEMCTQKQYFYNSQHINKRGAELFTNKLLQYIK
jgi:hypothetical protein